MKEKKLKKIHTKFDQLLKESGLKEKKVREIYEEITGVKMSYDIFYQIRKNNRPTTIFELIYLAKVFKKTQFPDVVDRENCIFKEL